MYIYHTYIHIYMNIPIHRNNTICKRINKNINRYIFVRMNAVLYTEQTKLNFQGDEKQI